MYRRMVGRVTKVEVIIFILFTVPVFYRSGRGNYENDREFSRKGLKRRLKNMKICSIEYIIHITTCNITYALLALI